MSLDIIGFNISSEPSIFNGVLKGHLAKIL